MEKERYLLTVRNGKERQGRRYLIAHLEGKRLTQRQAILAWCYDCMGFYDDGARDCESETCPLHPFMPYNPNKQPSVARIGKQSAEGAADDMEDDFDDGLEEESA